MTTCFFPSLPPLGKIYILIFWKTFKLLKSKGHNKMWPFHPVWRKKGTGSGDPHTFPFTQSQGKSIRTDRACRTKEKGLIEFKRCVAAASFRKCLQASQEFSNKPRPQSKVNVQIYMPRRERRSFSPYS